MLTACLIRPGNFTPPTRTPWGGHRIVKKYKPALAASHAAARIGESWEISVEPSFPSVLDGGESLADTIARDPVGWLGSSVAATFRNQSPLLVKLVDAAGTLSVQVHPPEHHDLLAPDESGKTEAWIILDADPGAQIYLGFAPGTDRDDVEQRLRTGESIEDALNAVPVAPGDVFLLVPGTIHALGEGVTLLEPQQVLPGKRAVTYRFYDWNRRYDANGEPDARGTPRPLHVREAIAVTDWDGPRGREFVDTCRRTPVVLESAGSIRRSRLLDEAFVVEEWTGSGNAAVSNVQGMVGMLCLSGQAVLTTGGAALNVDSGSTAVIPAAALPGASARLENARVLFCAAKS